MTVTDATPLEQRRPGKAASLLSALVADKFALCSAIFLVCIILIAILGPALFGELATKVNMKARNVPPLSFAQGWEFVLGGDSLGRSVLARLFVGAQNTLLIASVSTLFSFCAGGLLGLAAGYSNNTVSQLILRVTDVIMSFPSLLLALVVLYLLGSSIANVIIVLAITRMPVYLRTARAETMEIKRRNFVVAAETLGSRPSRVLFRHILPLVLPTLCTIAAVQFAAVVLIESSLSFLGLGVQLPDFTWGSMVASGRAYLGTAWWISFFPGAAILLTTLSLNMLGNWLRMVSDPQLRWRLQRRGVKK
jgi:peptide/nickel transport system permease protein